MLVAAIPFKTLRDAKSRLGVEDRSALAMRMLLHVIDALKKSRQFDRIALVSPDADILALAAQHHLDSLPQPHGDLNDACNLSASWAEKLGARGLLIAHADLPNVSPQELTDLVALAQRHEQRCVVIAPDRHGSGTNILLTMPPRTIPFAFGVDSRNKHRELARRANLTLQEFISNGTSHDVDTAEDLVESHL